MSYTRAAYKRTYTAGDSHLYSFIGTDGDLWMICGSNKEGFDVIKKEDAFELVVSILECAGIKSDKTQLKKLAKELDVKLRKRPLTWKGILNDMEDRSKKSKVHKK